MKIIYLNCRLKNEDVSNYLQLYKHYLDMCSSENEAGKKT